MNYVDSHCHLNSPELRGGIPAVLERARAAGVVRMAVIGSTLARDSLIFSFSFSFILRKQSSFVR